MKKILNVQLVTRGAKLAAGFAAGSLVTKAVNQPGIIGTLVPFIGAALTAGFAGKAGAEVAAGMATFGVVNAVRVHAPDISNKIGLSGHGVGYLPAPYSTAVNAVAGNRYADSFVTN
jgi:hypothetical protein